MTKENLNNNTKTRRKGSMLQDSISKIKYLIVLAFLLVIPMHAKAGDFGTDIIDQTDTGADRLIYYYDTEGRQTIIQITNTSDEIACVHVQLFQADQLCLESDAPACLTPGQTFAFDVATGFPGGGDFSNSHGFLAVSLTSGPEFSLIGMFRIIDDNGYEYRTNAAADQDPLAFEESDNILNWDDVKGNNFSDVIGITYVDLAPDQVTASPFIGTQFGSQAKPQVLNFDENEFPISCSPVVFTCDDNNIQNVATNGYINRGIDNSIPNSKASPPICNQSRLTADNHAGWLDLPFINYLCIDPDGTPTACDESPFGIDLTTLHFVGFLGLNNGDGSGTMDSWMSISLGGPIVPLGTSSAN